MEIDLDAMMTTEQACAWLGLGPADLLEKSKGKRNATIPAFWLGKKTVRFHPRTIIAKLAADAGVSPEVIAASFRLRPIDRSEKQIPI